MTPALPPTPAPASPPPRHPATREAAGVLGLVLLALALRLVNFGWGLPLDANTGYYHPDERKIVQGAVDFPGDVLTRTDLRYPTGYHYAVGLVSAPVRLALARLAPAVDPFLAAALVARLMTLVLALATVLATWWLGWRWYGPAGGLTAAAFVAVALVHVVHSGYATLDVPSAALAVAALWACDRVVRHGRRRDVLLTAVLSGLLIGTKYPGGVIVLPAALAITLGPWRAYRSGQSSSAGSGRRVAGRLLLYLGLTAGVVLLTTPTIALHPEHLRAAIAYEQGRQGFGETPWLDVGTWAGARDALEVAVGPAAGLLFVLALVALVVPRPGYTEALLVAFLVPYYLVLGERVANRYLVILVPVYALAIGRLLALALAAPRRWLCSAGVALVALAWLGALWAAVGAVAVIHQPDVRSAAARFLAEHAAAGATVCVDQVGAAVAEAWKEPPVSPRFRVVGCGEHPAWALTVGGLGRVERALASEHLRADHSWDPAANDWWPDGEPLPPERLAFYDQLMAGRDGRADYVLAAEFSRERLPTVPFDVSAVRVWHGKP